MNFFEEIYHRLVAETPVFFKHLQVVFGILGTGATAFVKEASAFNFHGVEVTIAQYAIAVCGGIVAASQLACVTPPDAKKIESPATPATA